MLTRTSQATSKQAYHLRKSILPELGLSVSPDRIRRHLEMRDTRSRGARSGSHWSNCFLSCKHTHTYMRTHTHNHRRKTVSARNTYQLPIPCAVDWTTCAHTKLTMRKPTCTDMKTKANRQTKAAIREWMVAERRHEKTTQTTKRVRRKNNETENNRQKRGREAYDQERPAENERARASRDTSTTSSKTWHAASGSHHSSML